MKAGYVLFLRASLLLACSLTAASPAAAFIKAPPPPQLGVMCDLSSHIYVLKVEKFNAEKGVILFKPVEELKAKETAADGTLVKLVVSPRVNGSKVILDWAAEGKKAVLFGILRSKAGHLYIDNSWYRVRLEEESNCWSAVDGEPHMLTGYCGTADKLGAAATKILRGEEVVVPAKLGEKSGRPIVRELRAGLRIPDRDKASKERKPDLIGTIQALSDDGKSFTLLPTPTNKNREPAAVDIQITDVTAITMGVGTGQLAVGQTVTVMLGKGDAKIAAAVRIIERK
jgi:hypothetical protein